LVAPEAAMAWLSGKLAGNIPLPGLAGEEGIFADSTVVKRGENLYFSPEFGVIMTQDGQIFRETAKEAEFLSPDLSAVPRPSGNEPEVTAGAVFMPWGGNTNYGHFLIDGLSGIEAIRSTGEDVTLLAPPLKRWQREVLALIGERPLEIDHKLVRIRKVIWSTCMNQFLHWPNSILDRLSVRLRDSLLQNNTSKKIYVSRSRIADEKRILINEVEVENLLSEAGFTVINPQFLSVREQAEIFNAADIVVSTTGAQLSNILFMRPGSAVVEICPTNYPGIWTRNICYRLGLDWHCHYFSSPEVQVDSYRFSYRIDAAAFVAFALSVSARS